MRDYLSEKHRSDLDAVSRCVGLVLSGVARSRYVFDGEPTEDDFGELELRFRDGLTITLYLASDAESARCSVRRGAAVVSGSAWTSPPFSRGPN